MDEQVAGEWDELDGIEAAWTAFRVRLADHLAQMQDGQVLEVRAMSGAGADEEEGATPDLSFVRNGEDLRAESIDDPSGWTVAEGASPNYVQVVDRGQVDRLAWECVELLRENHAVLHPVFLHAEGLERDPGVDLELQSTPQPYDEVRDDAAVLPSTHDELQDLVDAALGEMVEVEHDADGDIAIRAGQSVVFVHVLDDRPGVELFAEIVTDLEHPARLPVELDILNRTHDYAKFHVEGHAIRMSYQIVAWPFMARQLRVVLRRMLHEVDEIAETLSARVGGRRFLDEPEVEHPDTTPTHPGMVALLELLHLGPVSSPSVGQLFGSDRRAIIAQIVSLRTGLNDCGDHDQERVLTCLRRGLRYVVDGEIPERRGRRLPARPRTEQASLMPDDEVGEDSLDLGWSAPAES